MQAVLLLTGAIARAAAAQEQQGLPAPPPIPLIADLACVRVVQDLGLSDGSAATVMPGLAATLRSGVELEGQLIQPGLFLLVRAEAPEPWLVGQIGDVEASAHLDSGETLRCDPRAGLVVRAPSDRFGARLAASAPIGLVFGPSARPARRMTSIELGFHAYVVDHLQRRLLTLAVDGGQRWRVQGLGIPTGGDDLVLSQSSARTLMCQCSTHGLLRLLRLTVRDAHGAELRPNQVSERWGRDSLDCELGCPGAIAAVELEVAEAVRMGAVRATFVDVPITGALARGACIRGTAWTELPVPPALAHEVVAELVPARSGAAAGAGRP